MARRSIRADMTTPDLVHRIKTARAERTPLRIAGAATWLDAGRSCDTLHTVATDSGIVTYEPGDLTLTARAGTPLADIQRVTAAEGQWLTLDPHGSPNGTLGATVATGSWGPLGTSFGTPRDHVLGCEFVSGTGDVVNAGGRVVKNVAGFDLVRLVTGSWGTIGVLTELTVRLRAQPEQDVTLAIAVRSAEAACDWIRSSVHSPLAAELLSPTLAARISGAAGACFLVRIGGNAGLVTGARESAAHLGDAMPLGAEAWSALAGIEPPNAIVFRLSTRPSHITQLWTCAVELAEMFEGVAHATVARGVVRCVLPACDEAALLRLGHALTVIANDVTVIGERLPASLWPTATCARTTDALSLGVRRAFDPDRILNPGILGDT